jgi:hypothetical protein
MQLECEIYFIMNILKYNSYYFCTTNKKFSILYLKGNDNFCKSIQSGLKGKYSMGIVFVYSLKASKLFI